MDTIIRRLPTLNGLERNSAKIAGFAAGVIVPLVIVALFQVLYTGYGISEVPRAPEQIYFF